MSMPATAPLARLLSTDTASRARHELVQPTAALKVLVARLGDADADAGERARLADAVAQGLADVEHATIAVLAHQMLAVSPPAAAAEPVALRDVATSLAKAALIGVGGGDVAASGEAAIAIVDPHLIDLILTEAIDNAVAFSPEAPAVEISSVIDADGMIILSVRDHGVGLPDEPVEDLFEPYKVAQAAAARTSARLGLGLARASLAACAAKVQIRLSRPPSGAGAVFTLIAPAAPVP